MGAYLGHYGNKMFLIKYNPVCLYYTYADHVLADGVEVVDFFLLGSMDNDDCGAKDTEKAANLTVKVQLFIQQCGGEDSTVSGVCV